MGIFEGGLFDFDGSGETTLSEELAGLMLADELMEEESEDED